MTSRPRENCFSTGNRFRRMLKKAVLFVRRSSLVRRKEHMAEDGSLWLMAYSTDKDDLVLF
jgi:hypothetical protein